MGAAEEQLSQASPGMFLARGTTPISWGFTIDVQESHRGMCFLGLRKNGASNGMNNK